MMDYLVSFSRYGGGVRLNSAVLFFQAADFSDAHKIAGHMCEAMRHADPDNDYAILQIACRAYGGVTVAPGARRSGLRDLFEGGPPRAARSVAITPERRPTCSRKHASSCPRRGKQKAPA